MTITEKQFFEEELDLSIPELAEASRAFTLGDEALAEHIFAEYLKKTLKPECFFSLPHDWTNEKAFRIADNALENKFTSVGVPIDFGKGNKVDWYANPTYNRYKEWEVQFHRHHEWIALGQAYRESGDEKYAECFAKLVYSWITEAYQRPLPGEPANYHWRTLECGIRMQKNWNYPIHAFLHSPSVPDKTWVLIFMSLWEQAEHVFPKNTGYNWLMTEKTGLLYVAVLYPFMAQSKRWGDWALETLHRLSEEFTYPDNFEIELSTGYHAAVMNDFLVVFHLFSRYGIEFPEKFANNVHRMFYMYPQLTKPDLRLPSMNDGGGANIISICQRGSAHFPDDEVLRYFASEFKEGRLPDYKSIIMPYSGMLVMRTGFNPDDMWALFECAPYGADHQQEDKLMFMLYAYGVDMLPNLGFFRYDTSKMRAYVRSTRAHNTGLVDALPQNRGKTHKRVSAEDVKKKSDLRARIGEDFEVGEGIYNQGYGPDLLDATHKRKVVWFKKGHNGSLPFFVVIDNFSAADGEDHFYESSWQLPDVTVTVNRKKVTVSYENGAKLNMISSVAPRMFLGQYEPEYMGWRPHPDTESAEQLPAPLVSFAVKGNVGEVVTVLYPAPDDECPISDVRLSEGGFDISFGEKVEHFDYLDERFDADEV